MSEFTCLELGLSKDANATKLRQTTVLGEAF